MYGPMRIGGLASGMDIDQIVDDLMRAERMRVDNLYQQKQVMEWQKQDYRDINLKLRSLYNSTFDMKLSSSYLKYKAIGTMDDGTDFDKYFSVLPGAGAIPGEYKVEVQQMAEYARLESAQSITKPLRGQELSVPITIDDSNNKLEVTVDGVKKTITLTKATYDGSEGFTVEEFRNDIETQIQNAFGSDKVQVTIEESKLVFQPKENYQKFSIALEGRDALTAMGFPDSDIAKYEPIKLNAPLKDQIKYLSNNPLNADNKMIFAVNGKEFAFDFGETGEHKGYSLNDILQKISTDEDAGVKAYYDTLTDKVVMVSKETGAAQNIHIVDKDGSFFEVLGFSGDNTSKAGKDARITFNGTIVEKATNNFIVNGISFSLKKIMSDTQSATFKIENDPDAAVESIKKYIELYNETIDLINGKLTEERYRKFPPLTDEQRKEMSEKDIELWEEKAKSGLLRSDPLLDRIVNNLRSAVNSPVAGLPKSTNSLSAIGITTGEWKEKGKLHINEEKLRNAIAKDPESVMRLFNVSGDDFSSQGVATRVYDILKGGISDITDKAGGGEFQKFDNSYLGKQIRDMEDRIYEWEDRLYRKEEHYWRQFTEMEKAISYMNQQSMWLASQMGMYGQ